MKKIISSLLLMLLVFSIIGSSFTFIAYASERAESMMDPQAELEKALNGNAVFMLTNDTAYINSAKIKCDTAGLRCIYSDGHAMIPELLFEKYSGMTVGFDSQTGFIDIGGTSHIYVNSKAATVNGKAVTFEVAPSYIDGILYFPLRDICEKVLGKVVTWDDRGFAVVGYSAITLQNNYKYVNKYYQWYPIDLIYRFMIFDNPRGEEIINTVKTNYPSKSHPRILYTNEDIDYIKNKVFNQKDDEWIKAYNSAISLADSYVSMNLTPYFDNTINDKGHCVWYCQSVTEALSTAYLLTGETKYASKICSILRGFTTEGEAWKDGIGYESSHIMIGHWTSIIAIGTDACYNYLTSTYDGRQLLATIKNYVSQKLYAPHVEAYTSYEPSKSPMWRCINDNFIGVIGGGFMNLLLTFCDEDDMYEQSAYLLENVLRSLGIVSELFYSDGGYYEGVGYAEYLLQNTILAVNSLFNCCKTDYSLGKAPGFCKAGDFFNYMQYGNTSFAFHDSYNKYYNNDIREFFAYRYSDPLSAELAKNQKALAGEEMSLRALMFYSKAIDVNDGIIPDINLAPADKYFNGAQAGTFRSSHTSKTPTFAAFHGGKNGISHDSLDLGEFVFASDGVEWATDLGRDGYHSGYVDTYNYYRRRTEGENCVVINPSATLFSNDGQKEGAWASLVSSDMNKPKGAMAVYDLQAPYSRDASAYKRGYLFGDDRHTFTVRDEIKLRWKSELYWFMHTSADIEIISNNQAKLTKDGKTCLVDVYCSEEFTLKKMDARPLPSSPDPSAQNKNEGYSKLAIHCESASDDVVIAVKLSPENGRYTYTPLSTTPISGWSVPEGETGSVFEIKSPSEAQIGENKEIVLSADVSDDYENVELMLDRKRIDAVCEGINYSSEINYADINLGTHTFSVSATKKGESKILTKEFEITSAFPSKTILYTFDSLSGNQWSSNGTSVARCPGHDAVTNSGIKLYASKATASSGISPYFYVREGTTNLNYTDKTVAFEAYVKRDAGQSLSISVYDSTGSNKYGALGFAKQIIASDGKVCGTDYVLPDGEWKHLRIVTDLVSKYIKVYYEGQLIKEGVNTNVGAPYGVPDTLEFLSLQTYCTSASGGVYFDGIKISEYADANAPRAYVEGNAVSYLSNEITVNFDKQADFISADMIKVNGNSVKSAKLSDDGKNIVIGLSEPLVSDFTNEIVFSESASFDGASLDKKLSVFFKSEYELGDTVGKIIKKETEGNVIASVEIYKQSVNSTLPANAMLVIAAYSGSKLEKVNFAAKSLVKGEVTPFDTFVDSVSPGCTIKAFVWTGFENCRPIITAE